jgi:hypothetical protein
MLKKIIFILALTNGNFTFSQIEKGQKSIGINIGDFQNRKEVSSLNSIKSTNYSSSINFNYFVSDKFSIGMKYRLGIGNGHYTENLKYESISKSFNSTYGFTSSYYKKLAEKFYFVLTGDLNYRYKADHYTNKNYSQPIDVSIEPTIIETTSYSNFSNAFGINFQPSFLYFITPKFGLKAAFGNLNYSYGFVGPQGNSTVKNYNNEFELNFSTSSLSFGMNYFF